ncbi:MAG: hypothetical protein JWO49_1091 [Arthrobacter sp.]|nr:hypothetical protein [Arthrobacter sp.]
MTTPLYVHASPAAEIAGAVGSVVASLPVSFAPATGSADVVAVAGHPGWTERAAQTVRQGVRGVVVADPVAEDPAALAVAAAERGAVVVLDQQWAGNPVLAATQAPVRKVIADALADAVLLDSVAYSAPGHDPADLLTNHLAAVLQAGVELHGLRVLQRSAHGYTVVGQMANGAPAALHGITTSSVPPTATVSILTSTGRTDITLPDASAAWPAEVRSVTTAGATTLPSIYESAHRHSWRRLHERIESGGPSADLQQFAALNSLLSRLNA